MPQAVLLPNDVVARQIKKFGETAEVYGLPFVGSPHYIKPNGLYRSQYLWVVVEHDGWFGRKTERVERIMNPKWSPEDLAIYEDMMERIRVERAEFFRKVLIGTLVTLVVVLITLLVASHLF